MESLLDILPKTYIIILWKGYFPFLRWDSMKNRLEEIKESGYFSGKRTTDDDKQRIVCCGG